MQPKKNPNVNLEKKRTIHLQIGLILSLSLILISLEWATPVEEIGGEFIPVFTQVNTEELLPVIPRNEKKNPELPRVLIPLPVDEEFVDTDVDIGTWLEPADITDGYFTWFDDEEDDEVLPPSNNTFVEIPAEFPGGEEAMMRWIYNNIKYPEECVEHGIGGRVTAKFTISKFGKVTNIEIVHGVHELLDAEVMRVLELMPDFRPAIQNETLVPVFMYWPVVFKITQ